MATLLTPHLQKRGIKAPVSYLYYQSYYIRDYVQALLPYLVWSFAGYTALALVVTSPCSYKAMAFPVPRLAM